MKKEIKDKIKDVSHSVVKGAIGGLPVVGSLASEIFGIVVTPPLEKRRREWMDEVAVKLKELEEREVFKLEDLSKNELFIDVVLQATTFALKTSDKEKIIAFKNAVINTAAGDTPDSTKTQIFLNLLDSFTVWHIRILSLINSPIEWFDRMGIDRRSYFTGSIFSMIKDAYPDIAAEEDVANVIWDDLKFAGFHNTSEMRTMMSSDGVYAERTTPLGKQFLKFISEY